MRTALRPLTFASAREVRLYLCSTIVHEVDVLDGLYHLHDGTAGP